MKHLNGTLGWIPSDKPICVQEGKVLQPAPLPLPWTPLPWSACPCVASGPRPCVPEGSASGAAVCFGASPSRGQSSPCVSRGPGQQINHLGVIVFLLYRHYNPTYRCSCQCEIATQTTVALFAPRAANAGLLSPRLSRRLGECMRQTRRTAIQVVRVARGGLNQLLLIRCVSHRRNERNVASNDRPTGSPFVSSNYP